MIHSFSVERFRGLRKCDLQGMRRITLLTGKNNVGKSAILEGLFIHSGNYNPNLVMIVNALRGLQMFTIDAMENVASPWASIFYQYEDQQPIRLVGQVSRGAKDPDVVTVSLSPVRNEVELGGLSHDLRMHALRSNNFGVGKVLKLELYRGRKGREAHKPSKHYLFVEGKEAIVFPPPPNPEFQARLLSSTRENASALATQFRSFQVANKVHLLVEALQSMEPRLESLELVFDGEPVLHGQLSGPGRRLMPLPLMGDGLNRVTTLILAIGSCPGGTILVDDVDTGLHYSVMKRFWQSVFRAAEQFDVQVVATTHSSECAEAALEASVALERKDDFTVIRLERQPEKIATFTYTADELFEAVDANLEVR